MKKYILDISEVNREQYLILEGMPDRMVVVPGKHQKDFDVIEGISEEQHRAANKKLIEKYQDSPFVIREDWPIGFDLDKLPKGAKLEAIE